MRRRKGESGQKEEEKWIVDRGKRKRDEKEERLGAEMVGRMRGEKEERWE